MRVQTTFELLVPPYSSNSDVYSKSFAEWIWGKIYPKARYCTQCACKRWHFVYYFFFAYWIVFLAFPFLTVSSCENCRRWNEFLEFIFSSLLNAYLCVYRISNHDKSSLDCDRFFLSTFLSPTSSHPYSARITGGKTSKKRRFFYAIRWHRRHFQCNIKWNIHIFQLIWFGLLCTGNRRWQLLLCARLHYYTNISNSISDWKRTWFKIFNWIFDL